MKHDPYAHDEASYVLLHRLELDASPIEWSGVHQRLDNIYSPRTAA